MIGRPGAIAGVRETAGVPGNVHEVPEIGFAALVFDLVGPGGNGSQVVGAKKFEYLPFSDWGQMAFSNVSDYAMPFWSPGQ